MNYYQRHVGDITRDTFGLAPAEFGCYDRMLDYYYQTEKPLPLDVSEIHRIVGARGTSDRKAVAYVLGRYFTREADGWHQKRCDAELAEYASKAVIARANGRLGGRPKNPEKTDRVISGIPTGNPDLTQPKANQEPVTSNQEPEEKKSTRVPREVASLPPWLPPEDWARWAQHRGKKLTAAAVPLQIRKLDGLRAEGHDPVALIDLAIESGWATFWPPKDAPRGRHASLTAVGSRTAENLRRFADDEEMPNGTHGP